MKILVVQDTDWLKRGPHQQHHLMDRLSLKGHEVRVIDHELLWRTEGEKELYSRRQVFYDVSKVDERVNITVFRPAIIKIPLLDYVSMLFTYGREIRHQIREFKPDIIASGEILSTYLSLRAAKRNSIPFIYFEIDETHRFVPFRHLQPIAKILEKKILKKADRVITINEKLKDYAIRMGANPDKTYLVRAGIDLERYDPNIDGSEIRESYGIEKDDIVLFFMGWLYDFSGLKEVAIELSKSDNNIKLLIVGDGDAFDDLKRIREEYDLDSQMILTGKQPYEKIPEFIAAADICLLPAYPDEEIMQDIVPIKMYEYMAMRRPVITTRLPGVIKEFGEDHGVIYIDKSEDVLKKAIELDKNGNIKEPGLKARKFVEKYNWDDIVDEFEGILEELT